MNRLVITRNTQLFRSMLLCVIFCIAVSGLAASQDPAGGVPPYSVNQGGAYDQVDLATGRILVTIPVINKIGKVPISFKLVANYHVHLNANVWDVTNTLAIAPLAANLGAFETGELGFCANDAGIEFEAIQDALAGCGKRVDAT